MQFVERSERMIAIKSLEVSSDRLYSLLFSNKCIAVRKVATSLRELTCRMGSHSVTCHPAEVTFPPLPQPKLVLDSATPEGCKAELTCYRVAGDEITVDEWRLIL